MTNWKYKLYLIVFVLHFFNSKAFSINFQPIEQTLTPSGMGASYSFQLNNDQKTDIAFETYAVSRGLTLNGEEIRNPTEHFVIFPKSGMVKPGETKAIRVTYNGPSNIKSEMPYRIILNQIPLKTDEKIEDKAQIKYLMNFEASIYVTPEGVAPKIIVKSGKLIQNQLEVILQNKGTAHKILAKMEILLTLTSGETINILRESLEPFDRFNLLPGTSLKMVFPPPKNLKARGELKSLLKVQFNDANKT